MVSFVSRITSSLMGLLDDSLPKAEVENRLKAVRRAMLDCMSPLLDDNKTRPLLWDKVLYAPSAQALWYLRIDLMSWLSEHGGETIANQQIAAITEQFRGLLPDAQMSSARRFGR